MTNPGSELRGAETGRVDQAPGQVPATAAYQLLDRQFLDELYGDDQEYAACMLETFVESILPEFALLDEQIQVQRWEELHPLIHKLRPTLLMVGLTHMEPPLIQLENMMIENDQTERIHELWLNFYSTLQGLQPLLHTEWQRYLTTPNL